VLVAARELDQLGHERGHLAQLLDDVGEQLFALVGRHGVVAREHLDVGAEARERRAELVRGVGNELPLRASGLLECGEHRVEARREAAELVAPFVVDAAREIPGLRDVLRRLRQAPNRCERRACDGEPQGCRDTDTAEADEDEDRAESR
jgi:hypothetical protein